MDAKDHKTTFPDSSKKNNFFDPFNDRLSRDIRNVLSEAFIAALAYLNREVYLEAAGRWDPENLASAYRTYIQDRLQRYRRVFKQVQENRLNNALTRALVIWNQGLFFEFHDHLEGIWKHSSGDEHQALKGLIKAAGVYIHLEFNHQPAAERLAVKSVSLIEQYSHCLVFIANLNVLVEKLRNLDPLPPQLKNPEMVSTGVPD